MEGEESESGFHKGTCFHISRRWKGKLQEEIENGAGIHNFALFPEMKNRHFYIIKIWWGQRHANYSTHRPMEQIVQFWRMRYASTLQSFLSVVSPEYRKSFVQRFSTLTLTAAWLLIDCWAELLSNFLVQGTLHTTLHTTIPSRHFMVHRIFSF